MTARIRWCSVISSFGGLRNILGSQMVAKRERIKLQFKRALKELASTLSGYVSTDDSQWTIKGFIDVVRNVYAISADTKLVSKIVEIHLFPLLFKFAEQNSYRIVLAEHQNYYPDLSFIHESDESIRFAVDLKTTYRLPDKRGFCNGFTLGSHGSYFINRDERKNIQFPYGEYLGHFCLGMLYTRTDDIDKYETRTYSVDQLNSIASVIRDIRFFACEKWEIASDRQGSGNTANMGA